MPWVGAMSSPCRRHIVEGSASPLRSYNKAVVTSGTLALIGWASYGTHVEGRDPVSGGGRAVVDFVPTDEARFEHGLQSFLILSVVTCSGVAAGLSARTPGKRREEY